MFFLIILENSSTACSYSKFSMSLKSACNFFEKKLYHSMFVFFCVMKAACHLKQSLNSIVVSEQQYDLLNI